MADGSSVADRTIVRPRDEPPRAGFTANGSPSESITDSSRAGAPSSRKVAWDSAIPAGVEMPAALTNALATGLSQVRRHEAGLEPTKGMSNAPNTSRNAPSSPLAP